MLELPGVAVDGSHMLTDRFDFCTVKPGQFHIGLGIKYGMCADCAVFHCDVCINLGWAAIKIYLGQHI